MYIPTSLLELPNWCLADPNTKRPFSAVDNRPIKHDGNDKLITAYQYTDAQAAAIRKGIFKAPGFVLQQELGITCIDIDGKHYVQQPERYANLIQALNSYTEISHSGTGYHVWLRGVVPMGGRRFSGLELYSSNRFIMVTGNHLRGSPFELAQGQKDIDELIATAPKSADIVDFHLVEVAPTLTDEEVIAKGLAQANGAKFKDYLDGNWKPHSPKNGDGSQSECDHSFIHMLCFLTPSNEQVLRLFRKSGMHRMLRNKQDSYIKRSIASCRIREQAENEHVQRILDLPVQLPPDYDDPQSTGPGKFEYPPGFAGDFARELGYRNLHIMPQSDVTVVLGILSGILSGGWCSPIHDGQLNNYIVLLGMSHVGKNSFVQGFDKIRQELKAYCVEKGFNHCDVFDYLDNSRYVSPQAFNKNFNRNARVSFVHLSPEFSSFFTTLCHARKHDERQAMFKQNLLDLFGNDKIRTSYYADNDNTIIGSEVGVTYSLVGEAVGSTLFNNMTEDMLSDGFISRFTFVEYEGDSIENPNYKKDPLPPAYYHHLATLLQHNIDLRRPKAHTMNPPRTRVAFSPEADKMSKEFKIYQSVKLKGIESEAYRQKWGRQHEKAVRVASLLAIADNHTNPVITAEHFKWAVQLQMHSLYSIEKRQNKGEIGDVNEKGNVDNEAVIALVKIFRSVFRAKTHSSEVVEMLVCLGIVSHSFLCQRSVGYAVFRKSKATNKLRNDAISDLIDRGAVQKIPLRSVLGFEDRAGICYKWIGNFEDFKLDD